MARNLYRFYLYLVYIGMLGFAADGIGMLLRLLLAFTPLRGGSPGPTHSDVVQATIFAVVSLVIAVPLWVLHYWLIRRDMRADSAAGSGGVRSFFLNFAEAISLLSGVFTGAFVISSLGQPYSADVTGGTAYTIVSLAFFALLDWERRRSQAAPGSAIVFQRIHFYGAQAILLIGLTFSWFNTVGQILDSTVPPGSNGTHPNLLSLVASTLWIILFWLAYGLLSRRDTYSRLRQVLHYLSFAYGVGIALTGVNFLLQLALQTLFKVSVLPTYSPSALYSFVSPLTLGIIIVAVYSFWLSISARGLQAQQTLPFFIGEVIVTAFLAVSFWFGCGFLLYSGLEHFASPSAADLPNLVISLSSIITGIAYIPISLHLSRQHALTKAVGPRRALVFSLLGGGILVSVGSAITLLYMLLTSLLGAALFTGWQHVARGAGAALVVGLLIVGIYIWTATREHLFGAHKTIPAVEAKEVTVPASTPAAEEPTTASFTPPASKPLLEETDTSPAAPVTISIEDVLDELQAGKITRDEAAARIRELMGVASPRAGALPVPQTGSSTPTIHDLR